MINYAPGMTVDPGRFQPYDPEAGGALETDGDLQTRVTVDFQSEISMGGVFRQVKGRAEIVWPATEHAFVIEGEVTIHYHAENETVTYRPGDGWLIKKGERVTWTVTTPTFMKSYFLLLDD